MISLLKLTIEAALDAGDAILRVYKSEDFGVETKDDNSPLTIADKRANTVIVNMLRNSNIPILSEEEKQIPFSERKSWSSLWIVDPLDGTKEFIKRNGEFTVNIALIREGIPILGVVYVPVTSELYFAEQSIGSFKITVEGEEEIESIVKHAERLPLPIRREKFTVVASRSHMSEETKKYITNLNKEVELISSGSSIKICLVAEGKADCYPRFAPTMEWDTAAGHAIALYAGKNIYKKDEINTIVYNKKDLLNPWFVVK